jgi:putative ABC transport system ATP-binding protein
VEATVPRVTAIARALANKPQIILADEPTAALDTDRSVSVVKMLKKIALDQDVAIIMVTHDEAMLPFCDRILKIENKKVVSAPVPKSTNAIL